MPYAEQFAELKTDADRWKWIMSNQGNGLVVYLDNDNTFIVNENDEDMDTLKFDDYIGWSEGAQSLLTAIGIAHECV